MKFFETQGQKDHGEHTNSKPAKLFNGQRTGHPGYEVSRQKKTRERIIVKLVKRESKSLTHFSTTSCYIIDSILYVKNFCPNTIYM